ncbi:MAG: FumA C-terminus/TtdB family hydratase beta subunit [Nitrososphaerota archaeon]|nr:FumA C-terminus/TtdB family hydratase beta subunit [Nitrososphaerota archaeon]
MVKEWRLTTPLSVEDVRALKLGDVVFLSGRLYGVRDATLIRIFDHKVEPPVDLRGYPCIHTAPGVKKVGDRYEKVCIGTTTSARMERFTRGLIEKYGVRAILGKGGLFEESTRAMKEFGAVYLAMVGGAAALSTLQIEEIEKVYWEDLFPEALWQFRVKDFGPLFVGIDAHGNNLFFNLKREVLARVPAIYKKLGITPP